MKYLFVSLATTLSQLASRVGDRNIESILVANNLRRSPMIGKQFESMCRSIIDAASPNYISAVPDYTRKSSILNTMVDNSDVFEAAALLDNIGWKILSTLNTFPHYLQIPETVDITDSHDVLGNGLHIDDDIYRGAMYYLAKKEDIDPAIFNKYSSSGAIKTLQYSKFQPANVSWFKLPWGNITLYSYISKQSIDFPVYPEELSDSRKATYSTMPDMLYQYEPWYIYESSGPRTNTYTFNMHRHLWTGDHTDGKANELIRFCESNCYPRYSGAAVIPPTVTLYFAGKPLISGILEQVDVDWDGPLADDGWYLHFKLTLTISEIAKEPLNYDSVRNIPLIG